ncbi:MAG: inositol monophosphatase, partial [Rhodospirillaceae bacterium]|nr:inositol monophosphatase [Rhodospirillaceae bacterium]
PMDLKPDESPVTRADREAETAIRRAIEATYPEHGIYGEEFGTVRGDAEWLWLIDPLDGTKTFLHGRTCFSTLIGLAHRGRYVMGVIDFAALGDRWIGADGHGTIHNGKPVTTRSCADLGDAVSAATGPEKADIDDNPLLAPIRHTTRWQLFGLEAMASGLIASGRLDLAVDGPLDPTDIAALEPVVRNAGGLLTDLAGNSVDSGYAGRIVAGGDHARHAELIELLEAGAGVGEAR